MEERVVYINGQFIPESKAKISIFDRAIFRADALYDITRTFNKKPFKLREHIERLYKSCRIARIDTGMSPEEMEQISLKALDANIGFLKENDEYTITQIVTRGVNARSIIEAGPPTIIVYNKLIPFEHWARLYRTGKQLVTPSVRHVPPQCMDARLKTCSRLHFCLAELEAKQVDPNCYALLLDIYGNVTELTNANFFVVCKGTLMTPGRNILYGISRQTVLELAKELDITAVECEIQLYHVYNADEAFQTSTMSCILPVSRVNGVQIGREIPGPITKHLLKAWSEKVGVDIVEQALSHLDEGQ